MSDVKETLSPDYVINLLQQHRWAATGVSDYPPRDPLVGQSRFYKQYKTFIHTVDQGKDRFAHVFAVEGEWGRGKSRLGHELIAQINDCSKGWHVRNNLGQLEQADLFDDEAWRDQYLGLYIRYSQVASNYQNSDNWFGFGLYKALMPLATKIFDGSIQSRIAEQALKRLEASGFEASQLADALQIDKNHSDEILYEDPSLVTDLVQKAYAYFRKFGVEYVLVVLDELETVAEAATFGLEQDDAKRLDGQAIRLIGKAIKEEDPRRKLPWLRYVALCSPLLGQQLREIKSTARRFELVELEHNAFADVSDYVTQLNADSKLQFDYPKGLVEAAYAMSGANFGWFNVVMANVDAIMSQNATQKPFTEVGEVFSTVLESSGRIANHVLDVHAIEGIKTKDRALLKVARDLLFGQLPIVLDGSNPHIPALLSLENEDGDPVVTRFRRVQWDSLDCRRALEEAKFQRNKGEWLYSSVEQGLSLDGLMQNLRTFAIKEDGQDVYLVPQSHSEFKHLLSLLYDHPAAEFAADALWQKFIGSEKTLPEAEATHIGPSVAMLLRLDLRYRSQQHNSMIFRDPGFADAHEQAMKAYEQSWGLSSNKQYTTLRLRTRLTGLFRLLDKNWQYQETPYPNKDNLTIQMPPKTQGAGQKGGLLFCDGLKLHPNNQAWFAWINRKEELPKLHTLVTRLRGSAGRIPVMAFTSSIGVNDHYVKGGIKADLKENILLHHLNTSELDVLERIGLLSEFCQGFELKDEVFTTKFKNRLNGLRDDAYRAIHHWRHRLQQKGLIAWPLRPTGKLNTQDRALLFHAWRLFKIDEPSLNGLHGLMPEHGLDASDLAGLFSRLNVGSKAQAQGYGHNEQAGFFIDLEQPTQAQAQLPMFLAKHANPAKPSKPKGWTLAEAKQEWYWGYLWSGSGLNAKTIFEDWMWWCGECHLLKIEDSNVKTPNWIPVPKAELENAIVEAENWFYGKRGQDDAASYPATVTLLEQVYGYDQIPGLFAPMGKSSEGTLSVEANDQLMLSRQLFIELKQEEDGLTDNPMDILAIFPAIMKKRQDIRTLLNKIYPHEKPHLQIGNIDIIQLNNPSVSLYERVEQARLFAEYVRECGDKIRDRVRQLQHDIVSDPEVSLPFPIRLFTLSLETISNIFDGALNQGNASTTQEKEASGTSDTLLHFLRSLKLDQASQRLALLGMEVGYDLQTHAMKPFEDINGFIISTFRRFKTRYLEEVEHRLSSMAMALEALPASYPKPDQPKEVLKLKSRLQLIGDSFDELDEKVDEERQKFTQQARKGQFSGIKDTQERLLSPIQKQLGVVGGALLKIENAVESYRHQQLATLNGDLRPLIEPLFLACHEALPTSLQLADIKDLSLHDMHVSLDIKQQQWTTTAKALLAGSPIDLDRWRDIASTLLSGGQPDLSAAEQQTLVEKGILKVQVTFGGPA